MVECKVKIGRAILPPQKEADGGLHNLEKLEPAREDSKASLIRIVPIENTGRLLNSTGATARCERQAMGEEILSGIFRPYRQRKTEYTTGSLHMTAVLHLLN